MARDALYDAMVIDPLSEPVADSVAAEEKSKGPTEDEISSEMLGRIVAVLDSRSVAYTERGKVADESGAPDAAKRFIATAVELAYIAGTLRDGKIDTLEMAGKR